LPSLLHHSISVSKEPDPMQLEELNGRYQHLRNELDAAYAAPVWDSNRIDRIAAEMIPVELALASFQVQGNTEEGSGHV
jgi:hypothetical protein